ncbi:hypothetical protein CHUAL_003477 [Chamberlinius hualienensis]
MKLLLLFGISFCVVLFTNAQITTKRPGRLLGSYNELKPRQLSNPRVRNAISVGQNYLVANTTSVPCKESLSIKKVERQVVRGHNYRITFDIVENDACSNRLGTVGQTCTVRVHDDTRKRTLTPSQGECR